MMNLHLFEPDSPYGHEILNHLCDEGIPASNVHLFTAQLGKTATISYGDDPLKMNDISSLEVVAGDLFICLPDAKKTGKIIAQVLEKGGTVLDMSGYLRTDPDAPLYCDGFGNEIAAKIFEKNRKSRLPTVPALHFIKTIRPIIKETSSKMRGILTFLLPVSHVSKKARDELFSQTRNIYMNIDQNPQEFSKQIAFNLLPETGRFMDTGMTSEEWGSLVDIKQALGKDFKITVNGIQSSVFAGQSIQVNLEMTKECSANEARKIWIKAPSIDVIDLKSELEYVTPAEIQGEDRIYISRVREDSSVDNGLSYWSVMDNLRCVAQEVTSFVLMMSGK